MSLGFHDASLIDGGVVAGDADIKTVQDRSMNDILKRQRRGFALGDIGQLPYAHWSWFGFTGNEARFLRGGQGVHWAGFDLGVVGAFPLLERSRIERRGSCTQPTMIAPVSTPIDTEIPAARRLFFMNSLRRRHCFEAVQARRSALRNACNNHIAPKPFSIVRRGTLRGALENFEEAAL